MHFSVTCLLLLCAAIAISAEPQLGLYNPMVYSGHVEQDSPNYFFRSGANEAGIPINSEGRFFIGTVSLTLGTTTSTITITSSTTCTTSTKAISICSPSGRRRRGLGLAAQKNGLYFNEEEDSIFLPHSDPEPVSAVESELIREERQAPMVPVVIQPGYSVEGMDRNARFLIAFKTSTSYTTTTSTYIARLTALCKSSTGFSSC